MDIKYLKILFIGFILFLSSCKSHDQNIQIIHSFLVDVKKSPINYTYIIDKYIVADTSKDKFKRVEWLSLQLTMLHNQIAPISIKKLSIIPYYDLPEKEQKFFNSDGSNDNIYCIKMDEKLIRYILIKDKKIAALMTMNKGGTKIFLGL